MGLRLVMGSWKTMEIWLPRISRILASGIVVMSSPLKVMVPPEMRPTRWGSRRRMLSAVVVLPAPVSPTRPRVSPFSRDRFTPLTA